MATHEKNTAPNAAPQHHDDDYTVILGMKLPIPVYTTVFIVLGVMTLFEVLVAETDLFAESVNIVLLLGIASVKALLVMWFYMHLRTDSRFFAVALGLPLFMSIVAIVYLLGVPVGY